jgi:hypothetical protein
LKFSAGNNILLLLFLIIIIILLKLLNFVRVYVRCNLFFGLGFGSEHFEKSDLDAGQERLNLQHCSSSRRKFSCTVHKQQKPVFKSLSHFTDLSVSHSLVYANRKKITPRVKQLMGTAFLATRENSLIIKL